MHKWVEILRSRWLHVAAVLLIAWSVRHVISGIDDPFVGGHHLAGHQALQATSTENFLQHGYFASRFGVGPYRKDARCPKGWYINHPTLSVVLSSLPAAVFGNTERVNRATQLVLYLLNLYLVFCVGRKLFGERLGLVLAVVYAYIPVDRVYSILPAWHGTWFHTFGLLILLFILQHNETHDRRHAVLFFAFFFLAILNEWTCAPFLFMIAAYYVFLRRDEIFKGFFWILLLAVLGAGINFLHAAILAGHLTIDEQLGQFVARAGRPEPLGMQLSFAGYLFVLGFGVAAAVALTLGVYGVARSKDRTLRMVVWGQLPMAAFLLLAFHGALYIHWFLFMMFSPLIVVLLGAGLKRLERHAWVAVAVVALVVANSELVMHGWSRNALDGLVRDRPIVENIALFVRPQALAERFVESHRYGNDTLVLVRDPGFYIADYYLARAGYCMDIIGGGRPEDYRGYPEFRSVVFIDLDAQGRLVTRRIRPAPGGPLVAKRALRRMARVP